VLRLSRVVRLALGPSPANPPSGGGNGLFSVVAAEGLAPAVEVEVECIGTPEATGYLVDITVIDRGVRDLIAPILRTALQAELGGAPSDLRSVLQACAAALAPALPAALSALTYRPSPFRSAMLELGAPPTHFPEGSLPMPDAFVLTETFEFAASHRLHLPGVSADENRALFGKCNNPNGHGHNYRIEVAVEMAAQGKRRLDFGAIEGIVQREVMARFDHKHLNLDCPEFAALNPSVENIAMVCHGLLAPRFAEAGGALRFVRVWETEKTSCRYPA
jgi:6-pyruvoyltetrahydropterin/6-carboxytetrahydropterin synthase